MLTYLQSMDREDGEREREKGKNRLKSTHEMSDEVRTMKGFRSHKNKWQWSIFRTGGRTRAELIWFLQAEH